MALISLQLEYKYLDLHMEIYLLHDNQTENFTLVGVKFSHWFWLGGYFIWIGWIKKSGTQVGIIGFQVRVYFCFYLIHQSSECSLVKLKKKKVFWSCRTDMFILICCTNQYGCPPRFFIFYFVSFWFLFFQFCCWDPIHQILY